MNEFVLRALQQCDEYVCQVLETSADTALYKFDGTNNKWEKLNVEGTFYLCKRTMTPFYCFIILNTSGGETLEEKISKEIMIQLQEPFLLYKRTGEVKGILFKENTECHRVANAINLLLKDGNGLGPREGHTNAVKPGSSPTVCAGHHSHNSESIPQSQATTSPGHNSIIRMLHSAAAKQSPASGAAKMPDTIRSRPQTIATPQHQHQQAAPTHAGHTGHAGHAGHHAGAAHNHVAPNSHIPGHVAHPHSQQQQAAASGPGTKGAGHWSSKTTTISVDYLFKSLSNSGTRSPPRTSSPKQAPAPAPAHVPTSSATPARPAVAGAAMTLSEVEQLAMAEASERLRQQLGISGSGDGSRVPGLNRRSGPGPGPGPGPAAPTHSQPSAVVAVDEDGEDEDALVLTPGMLLEQASARPPSPTGQQRRHPPRSLQLDAGRAAAGSAAGAEPVGLNQEQLRQALLTIIAEDDDFLSRVHQAYIRSLHQRLK